MEWICKLRNGFLISAHGEELKKIWAKLFGAVLGVVDVFGEILF